MKLNNIAGLTVRFHWSVLILVAITTANLNIYLMTKYHDAPSTPDSKHLLFICTVFGIVGFDP